MTESIYALEVWTEKTPKGFLSVNFKTSRPEVQASNDVWADQEIVHNPDDPHPFSHLKPWDYDDETLQGVHGVVVAPNAVTNAIVEILAGGPAAIQAVSGSVAWTSYRAKLIASLQCLWD